MNLPSESSITPSNRHGSSILILIVVLVVVAGFVLNLSLYTVREWEQAVVLQFGEVIGEPTTEAGLHFKLPWQKVENYDRRLLRWDGNQTTTITRDRRTVNIDVTARWRIEDARRFREAIGSVYQADSRLNGIIQGAVKDEIAKFELFEVVRSSNRILDSEADISTTSSINPQGEVEAFSADELATLGSDLPRLSVDDNEQYLAGRPIVLRGILREAQRRLQQVDLGIHLEDILIKQLGYIQEIEANVYAQMNAELQKIAAGFRSSGRERAEQRLGEMQRELAVIESSGIERAQRIRGEAEAESIKIYADAYNRDPEFFQFLRTLEAFEKTIVNNGTLVISTDSPLYQLLKNLEKLAE